MGGSVLTTHAGDHNMATNASPGHLFINGKVFLHETKAGLETEPRFGNTLYVHEGITSHVRSESDEAISAARAAGAGIHDLRGRTLLPGFIDGHIHLPTLGQALKRVALDHCIDIDDIRKAIKDYAVTNPDEPRTLCNGWMRYMSKPLASSIDDLDPRPIFIDSTDLHTIWCNSAALEELDAENLQDPEGGHIECDADGKPTDALSEACVFVIIWLYLVKVSSKATRHGWIRTAVDTYNTYGYTGAIDMAMEEQSWSNLMEIRKENPENSLSLRLAAYWLIRPSSSEAECLRQVDRAIEVHRELSVEAAPDLHVVGIKLVCDGIVDPCTAYLSEPYLKGADALKPGRGEPFRNAHNLNAVVRKADATSLQIALHAISDATITMAVDALAECSPLNRHRIEYLELTSLGDAKRIGEHGM
jgi:predicted amidohydrolase YtcJ